MVLERRLCDKAFEALNFWNLSTFMNHFILSTGVHECVYVYNQ